MAASSGSLARSKGTAAIAAQNTLESLAALYQQDPSATDLALGRHGPRQMQVLNPADGSTLNRYSTEWEVRPVSDPRPDRILDAKLVSVTITPVFSSGALNSKPGMNKIVNVSTILSLRGR
jgi:hypothetical protein